MNYLLLKEETEAQGKYHFQKLILNIGSLKTAVSKWTEMNVVHLFRVAEVQDEVEADTDFLILGLVI